MATNEYNQEQTGMRSELDEPRRTTENTGFDQTDSGYGGQGGQGGDTGYGGQDTQSGDRAYDQSGQGGDSGFGGQGAQGGDRAYDPSGQGGDRGYGGVSENEPPHHKIHTDDEPLPKPTGGAYGDDQFSTPSAAGTGGNYGDDNTEKFQDSSSDQPQTGSYDDTPDTQTGNIGGGNKTSGGYSDPSSAFSGAPVDQTVQQPGYGQDTQASDPYSTGTGTGTGTGMGTGTGTGTGMDSPTPKKEGFVQKLKEKLPGKHKGDTTDTTVDDDTPMDTGTPKKGLMTKIKEKLPGHHSTTE